MAQMPGEARGYQFAPQQAAGTPAAMVDNFSQIEDLPTLIDMQQRNPSIPLLAHIDEVRKKLQAKQAVANNLAIQQAQQQGPQTLNDQILGSAAQVAGMSPVRRMAAGGIVALRNGGNAGEEAIEQLRRANMVTPEVQAQRDQIAAQYRAQRLRTPEAARAKLEQLARAVSQTTEADSRGIFERELRLTAQALRILESQGPIAALRQGVETLIPAANAASAVAAAPTRAAQQVSTTPVADDQSVLGPQGPLLTTQIPAPPGTPATAEPLLPGGLSFRPNTRLPDRMPGESFTDYRDRAIKFQEAALKEERRLKEEREQTERDIEFSRRGGRPAVSSPFVPPTPQTAQPARRFNLIPDERDPLAREVVAAGTPATAGQADAAVTTGTATAGGPAGGASTAADRLLDAYTALANVYQQPVITPEIREQRKKVADIQELITKQAFDEATRAREELNRELARREGRLNKPFLEGDMLPLLASFLSAKKGEFFPSLAKGLAAVSTEEEKARKELAQYRTTEGDRVRQINDLYRKMQLENARYNNALAEGDLKTAREAQEKLATHTYNYRIASEKLDVERRALEKPPAEVALMEWLRSPANRKIYEEAQSLKREDDRMAKLYEIFTKNKLSLGDMSFEQFVAGFKQAVGAAPSDVPPAGAVKQKGGQ